MRRFILLVLTVILSNLTMSQNVASSFKDANDLGLNFDELDKNYPSAIIFNQSEKSVFKTPEEQDLFQKSYIKLLNDLSKHLVANDFYWEETRRCFNRIYFNEKGHIDYFLYNFKKGDENDISKEKVEQFNTLLTEFIKDYQLNVQTTSKFAQCSPVTYQKNKEQ